MSALAPTSQTHALPRYTLWLAWIFIAGFVVVGVYEAAFGPADAHRGLVAIIFLAGAVLIAAGLFAFRRTSPWVAVALVTVGALGGSSMVWWTLGVPIVAIALIVLMVLGARRGPSLAVKPAA